MEPKTSARIDELHSFVKSTDKMNIAEIVGALRIGARASIRIKGSPVKAGALSRKFERCFGPLSPGAPA